MLRILLTLLLLCLSACMPPTPPQELPQKLPEYCLEETPAMQLQQTNWLNQSGVWRLRQSALLEMGRKKIPLEGFLRLDLAKHEARLVAMNEAGLVLFDLSVTADGQQLKRSVPQLKQVDGFAAGVAQSLRQIFFQVDLQVGDKVEKFTNMQRIRRKIDGGTISFNYDCRNKLRSVKQKGSAGDWRVIYNDYQHHDEQLIPEEIIMKDYRHRLKLSLWISAARQEQ